MLSMNYMANEALTNSFYKSVLVLATIVGGFMYVEKGMKASVREVMAPYVQKQAELEIDTKSNVIDINTLKEKSSLNEYKWSIYETQIRNFIKPDEPEIKRREK